MVDSGGGKRRALAAVLCLWGLTVSLSCGASRLEAGPKQKLKVQKHLKRLNKAPVKSIQVVFPLPFQYLAAEKKTVEEMHFFTVLVGACFRVWSF